MEQMNYKYSPLYLMTALDSYQRETGRTPEKITANFDTYNAIKADPLSLPFFSMDGRSFAGIPFECVPEQDEKIKLEPLK